MRDTSTTLAVFSDVHANLPALEAVLGDIDSRLQRGEIDAVYCLGDLVGYAPWPDEVVTAIRKRGIPTIAGNYDEGVGIASDDCGCAYKTDDDRRLGDQSIAFTNDVISEASRTYLRGLPRHLRLSYASSRDVADTAVEVLMVHGSPRRVNEYLFQDRSDASLSRLIEAAGAHVMMFGHTHIPYHRKLNVERNGSPVVLHAINTGSVGKPKDGDPRACYALVTLSPALPLDDPDYCSVEFVRLEYDVERAAQAIRESALPDAFGDKLKEAR